MQDHKSAGLSESENWAHILRKTSELPNIVIFHVMSSSNEN